MKWSPFARLAGAALFCFFLGFSVSASADALQDAGRLFKQGQYAAAMKQVNAWLAKNPKDAQGRFLKGLIFTEENKADEAIKVFTQLTEDYPELPEPYNNLAVLYAAQGQYDKAKDELESAIQTHPSYATAHENLGDIYAKLASQAYDRALQLDKSNSKVQTKLELIKTLFSKERAQPAHQVVAARKVAKKEPEAVKPEPAEPVAARPAEPVAARPAEPVQTAETGYDAKDVIATIEGWAKAWSAQDVEGYLAYYAEDFLPPDGKSLKHWKQLRKVRIEKPQSISVTISDPVVSFGDEKHATIRFTQTYKSSLLDDTTVKLVNLTRIDGKWLIESEKVGH